MSGNGHKYPWPTVALGQVVTHRKEFITIDDGYRYKRCRVQLHAKGVVLRDIVDGTAIKTKKQQVCRAGEFLVAEIDAKVGGFGIVPPDLEGAIVSSHYFLFPINPDLLDRDFLHYYCRTPGFREQVAAKGSTNYAAVRPSRVLEYSIPLPPLPEQKRIVAKVQSLMSKIDEARELRKRSTTIRSAVLDAFTDRLFQGLAACKDVEVRDLGSNGANPVQTGPFGAQLHKSDFVEKGTPVLNVGNVWPDGLRLNRLDHVEADKAAQLSRYSLQPGDLLFARTGATLGKVCVLPRKCAGWLMTGHLFRVRFDRQRCHPEFAFAAFRSCQRVRVQVFDQVRGATRPGFNTSLLSQVELPLPSIDEQLRVVESINRFKIQITHLMSIHRETAHHLGALAPSILDGAFKGKL